MTLPRTSMLALPHLYPTLHKPVPMKSRVIVPEAFVGESYGDRPGTVVGISSVHVVFVYVVLLDQEISTEWGIMQAVCVPGPQLEKYEGGNWRLEEG
jgi:hypothetical protein